MKTAFYFLIGIYLSTLLVTFPKSSQPTQQIKLLEPNVLAKREISLAKRDKNTFVNNVFRDNILLTLSYMTGKKPTQTVDWQKIDTPAVYSITLKPNESFAFHDSLLSEFKAKEVKTTNSHFSADEGFKSDGYLFGDGVCHLASLLYWVAKDANLNAVAPANHDFRIIPEIPKQYGVAIYAIKGQHTSRETQQNLYITNTLEKSITISLAYKNDSTLSAQVVMN